MRFEKAIGLQLGMLCFNRIIELVQVTDFKNWKSVFVSAKIKCYFLHNDTLIYEVRSLNVH